MAKTKKKGPAPAKKETNKRKLSTGQVVFAVFAVLMVLLMVGPLILNFFL